MTTTVPTPIVSWETVVSLSDPLHKPTRQRLRSLRAKANLSAGVQVTTRRGGRAAGSVVYYSALSALSAKAREVGDVKTAAVLGRAGTELESRFSALLREFLATRPVTDLPQAPFYDDLVRKTGKALDRVNVDFVWLSGRVEGSDGELTSVVAEAKSDRTRVDLPSKLLVEAGATSEGDHVWIMRELVGKAAVLTVLQAVSVEEEDRGKDYLEKGAGAPISEAEAAYFRSRKPGSLPKARILRPAG